MKVMLTIIPITFFLGACASPDPSAVHIAQQLTAAQLQQQGIFPPTAADRQPARPSRATSTNSRPAAVSTAPANARPQELMTINEPPAYSGGRAPDAPVVIKLN